ncbi:MAG: hypothetical protein ACD_75C01665G0003 [uncultured bacterium]|nr:MAG: hypothetical protein ACD_75C01665G0003 [uncultured bacterium]
MPRHRIDTELKVRGMTTEIKERKVLVDLMLTAPASSAPKGRL